MTRRALLSVSDKTGLAAFAQGLSARGFEIVSTGGTAATLADAGLKVTSISAVTGFPEMMDGRVKTLHPAVHAGILARRGRPDDLAALAEHRIGAIDVVCVNLYPFEATARRPDVPVDVLLEQIDIGGPTLVRAAAKNFQDVVIVVDPADYQAVLEGLDASNGVSSRLRLSLAKKAFAHTAAYDAAITQTLGDIRSSDAGLDRSTEPAGTLPERLVINAPKARDLRYGENPHMRAAWYSAMPPAGFGRATVLQGKELSFTNLLDLDAAARLVAEFDEPAAVVIKHTTPSGVAIASSVAEAYRRARDADALSAFGGVVGLNRPVDLATAQLLVSTFVEAVVAPSIAADARPILATKANMRVLQLEPDRIAEEMRKIEVRSILGGFLAQDRDRVQEARTPWPTPEIRIVTRRHPSAEEWEALRFAWRVAAHVKSNTIVFSNADTTLAMGAGQMSRVDAVKVATMKALVSLTGSVVASDAFFPFRDGVDAIADAGATAVAQPGGSVSDEKVIAAADERGLAMVFTGRRHFRH